MNLPEIVDAVKLRSGSPHLQDLVEASVRSSLSKAHGLREWFRDLFEETVTGFSTSDVRLAIPLPNRWKRFDYILANTADGSIIQLTRIDPPKALSRINTIETDVFYIAGSTCIIYLSEPAISLTQAYYRYPSTALDSGNEDWIAANHPELLICYALTQLYKDIDLENKAASIQDDLAREELNIVMNAFFVDEVEPTFEE